MYKTIFVWLTAVALTFTLTNFGLTQIAYSTSSSSLGDSIREEVNEEIDSNNENDDSNNGREEDDNEEARNTDRDDESGEDASDRREGNADNSRDDAPSFNLESLNQEIEDPIRDNEREEPGEDGEDGQRGPVLGTNPGEIIEGSLDIIFPTGVGIGEGSGMQIFVLPPALGFSPTDPTDITEPTGFDALDPDENDVPPVGGITHPSDPNYYPILGEAIDQPDGLNGGILFGDRLDERSDEGVGEHIHDPSDTITKGDRGSVGEGSGMQIFSKVRDTIESLDADDADGDGPIFRIPGVIKIWAPSPDSDRGLICNYREIPCSP